MAAAKGVAGKPKKTSRLIALDAKRLRQLLPRFHQHTQGKSFSPQAFRAWLGRLPAAGKLWRTAPANEFVKLLKSLSRAKTSKGGSEGASAGVLGVWKSRGVRYTDPKGDAGVSNIMGFASRQRGASRYLNWHEYGFVYRLVQVSGKAKSSNLFEVTRASAFKRLGCVATLKDVETKVDGKKFVFRRSIIFDPRQGSVGVREPPQWTLIYLHSFSNKGADYANFPHYFGISGARIRVVVPSAPSHEQTCFKHWKVWRGERAGWRRIKFTSWFDYLTDKAGSSENELDLQSLLEMRSRLHELIRSEVRRLGGNARRVLLGGASQGCCVALDAALTYPEELGGVIGLVGHHLSCTPLDPAKVGMPIYLFHEATDKEMKWRWVKGTVQRLRDAGFNVISKREADPAGAGHWIQVIEGEWIRSALRRIVLNTQAASGSDDNSLH